MNHIICHFILEQSEQAASTTCIGLHSQQANCSPEAGESLVPMHAMWPREGQLTVYIFPDLHLIHAQSGSQHCGRQIAAPSSKRRDSTCVSGKLHSMSTTLDCHRHFFGTARFHSVTFLSMRLSSWMTPLSSERRGRQAIAHSALLSNSLAAATC